MTIATKIEAYADIVERIAELELKKRELSDQIKAELAAQGLNEFENNTVKARITSRTTFKYTDEVAIINYLRGKKLNKYINEKIATTALNKDLKISGVLRKDLCNYIEEAISDSLTVTRKVV